MEVLLQVVTWGIAPNETLIARDTEQSLAVVAAILHLPLIDRRNVYAAILLEPREGDYRFRVGYEQAGNKEWWAGDSFKSAVSKLAEAMSPEGRAERKRLNIPMPGE